MTPDHELWSAMLADCEKREALLFDWERGFVDSVSRVVASGYGLSEKQIYKLDTIWTRVTDEQPFA